MHQPPERKATNKDIVKETKKEPINATKTKQKKQNMTSRAINPTKKQTN